MLTALNRGVLDGDSLVEAIMEDEQSNHWHLDKKLNVGHLITTLALAGSMVVWAMTIETRIAEHTIQIVAVASQIDRVDARSASDMQSVTEFIIRIDNKLDRLIERKQTR